MQIYIKIACNTSKFTMNSLMNYFKDVVTHCKAVEADFYFFTTWKILLLYMHC